MTRMFLALGGGIFFVLGTLHGFLILRDIARPRAFTPTDEGVRYAMQAARLALNPRANLWQVWLGVNLSHSLGMVLFGGGVLVLAWHHFGVFVGSQFLQTVAVVIAATYLVLSLRFWFWAPALGSGVALLCILVAAVASWGRLHRLQVQMMHVEGCTLPYGERQNTPLERSPKRKEFLDGQRFTRNSI